MSSVSWGEHEHLYFLTDNLRQIVLVESFPYFDVFSREPEPLWKPGAQWNPDTKLAEGEFCDILAKMQNKYKKGKIANNGIYEQSLA